MIRSTKPKSCSLDPVPTLFLMEYLDIVLPFITAMCKKSLQEGRLPSSQRHAIVTPILKKTGLDAGNVVNYRPISNLTYISKLVERMVNQQVVAYLNENKLLPKLLVSELGTQPKRHCWRYCPTSSFRPTSNKSRCWCCWTCLQHLIPSITPYCFKDWSLPSECPVSFCLGCRPSSMAVPCESIYSIPRLRSSLSGLAYRREASSDLCCSFSIQQIFPWSLPNLASMYIATPMTVNSTSRRRLVQRSLQSSWWRPASANWISGCHQTASSSTQTRLSSSGWAAVNSFSRSIRTRSCWVHPQFAFKAQSWILESSWTATYRRGIMLADCAATPITSFDSCGLFRNHSRLGLAPNWCMLS